MVRQKEIYDGAIPSGNSIALMNLIRLYRFTGKSEFEDKASQMIKTFSQSIKTSPSSYTQFLSGLDFYLGPSREILLAGNDDEKIRGYLKILRENFIPNKVILCKSKGNSESLSKVTAFTKPFHGTRWRNLSLCL
ncbi:MAG: hypothetical protein MZV64_12290 [Ignavibacteriales bacterium]|nr:hypothetical protein [Ignavibacteriales bacterium]